MSKGLSQSLSHFFLTIFGPSWGVNSTHHGFSRSGPAVTMSGREACVEGARRGMAEWENPELSVSFIIVMDNIFDCG